MLYVDQKYVGLLSSRLRNFRRVDRSLYQFSCPFCGDSRRDRRKARCYAYERGGSLLVYCHKCGKSTNTYGLVRHMDPGLLAEYSLETYEAEHGPRPEYVPEEFTTPPVVVHETVTRLDLPSVAELSEDHVAVRTVRRRRIPEHRWKDYYHAEDFATWSNTLVPGRYPEPGDARLVIPIWSRQGTLVGYQGRSYDPAARSRYLTAALDKEVPFLYGWDRVVVLGEGARHGEDEVPDGVLVGANEEKAIVAVEGPIDSEFVPNGVASAGGKVTRELLRTGVPRGRFVVAYDNEPRSPSTVDKVAGAIAEGFPVFIWPQDVVEKDFNDLVMKMMDDGAPLELALSRVDRMVSDRTFSGMEAELELLFWKKV